MYSVESAGVLLPSSLQFVPTRLHLCRIDTVNGCVFVMLRAVTFRAEYVCVVSLI